MDDDIEGISGEGVVNVGLALGLVEGVRGDEDRGIASINKAVVEEETEGARGGDGAGDLLIGDGVANDLLKVGARLLVVTDGKFGLDGGGEGKGDEEEEK